MQRWSVIRSFEEMRDKFTAIIGSQCYLAMSGKPPQGVNEIPTFNEEDRTLRFETQWDAGYMIGPLRPNVEPDTPLWVMTGKIERDVMLFNLRQLPGCCGCVVSTGAHVGLVYRGKGLGKLGLELRERAAWHNGYRKMLATTVDQNDTERHILRKFGWKEAGTNWTNDRTGRTIVMHEKILTQDNVGRMQL